jgi:hypothetical protein
MSGQGDTGSKSKQVLAAVVGAAATAVAGARKAEKGSDLDPEEVLEVAFAQAIGSCASQAELVYAKHENLPGSDSIDQSITELVDVFGVIWRNETMGLQELAKAPPAPLGAKHRTVLKEMSAVSDAITEQPPLERKALLLYRGLKRVHRAMKG